MNVRYRTGCQDLSPQSPARQFWRNVACRPGMNDLHGGYGYTVRSGWRVDIRRSCWLARRHVVELSAEIKPPKKKPRPKGTGL